MLWNLPYMLWNLHRNSSFTRKNGPRGLKFFRWPHLTKLRNPNIILTIQFPGGGVIYHPPGLTLPKSFFLLHKLIVKTPTQPQLNLTSTKRWVWQNSRPPPTQPTNPYTWLLIFIPSEKYSLQPFYTISHNIWLNALLFLSDKILCQETSIIMINYPLESAHWNNIKNPDIYMLKSEWLWVRM